MMYHFDMECVSSHVARITVSVKNRVQATLELYRQEPRLMDVRQMTVDGEDAQWGRALLERASLYALSQGARFLRVMIDSQLAHCAVYIKAGFIEIAPNVWIKALNPLEVLMDLDHAARVLGFVWDDAQMALEKVREETEEVAQELSQSPYNVSALEAELGDLLFATLSLGDFLGCKAQDVALRSAVKFSSRMDMMRRIADEKGAKSFKGQDAQTLLSWWAEARMRATD